MFCGWQGQQDDVASAAFGRLLRCGWMAGGAESRFTGPGATHTFRG